MTGTTPPGVTGEQAAALWVRGTFGKIARHYDLLNHLLSFNLDRRWRARLVERVASAAERQEARVLDLCCGTGDVLIALEQCRNAAVFGSDFCHPMLVEAANKVASKKLQSTLFESDALALPLADESFDVISVAFGFRNLANYQRGLEEMFRILKPGGVAAILEFSQPTNPVFGPIYEFFLMRMLPSIGGIVSGSREAYAYLPESIRKFPGADELAVQIRRTGYRRVQFERMTGGAVALHLAWK